MCDSCDHNLPKILTALNGYSNSSLDAQRAAVTSFNGEVGFEDILAYSHNVKIILRQLFSEDQVIGFFV